MDQNESQQEQTDKANPSKTESISAKNQSGTGSGAMIIAAIAIAVAGASFFYSYQQNQLITQAQTSLQTQAQQLSQVDGIKQQVGESAAVLEQNLTRLQGQLDHLRLSTTADSDSWVLAEVEYSLRLASLNLLFDQNVEVAKKILSAVDLRTQSLSDANQLRSAIASDLAQLEAVPAVDQVGLVVRLAALSKMVESLPITDHKTAPDLLQDQEDLSATKLEQKTKWRQALNDSMTKIKGAFVIRRLDKPLQPLLSPQQHANLVENIQFQLSLASWAVLHRDVKLYQLGLGQAHDWVKSYLKDSDSTKALITALEQLKTIDVAPKVPSVDHSLRAVQQMISAKARHQLQPRKTLNAPSMQNTDQTPRMLPEENQPKVLPS